MLLSYVFINPTTASASSLSLEELNTVSEVLEDAEAILQDLSEQPSPKLTTSGGQVLGESTMTEERRSELMAMIVMLMEMVQKLLAARGFDDVDEWKDYSGEKGGTSVYETNNAEVKTLGYVIVDGDNRPTLQGYVDTNGTTDTKVWFEWTEDRDRLERDADTFYGLDYSSQIYVPSSRRVTEVASTKGGFIEGREYYYRINANTTNGRVRGSIKSFVIGEDDDGTISESEWIATRRIDAAEDLIGNAEDAIEDAENDGFDTEDAEERLKKSEAYLSKAEDEFDDGDWDDAMDYADDAIEMATSIIDETVVFLPDYDISNIGVSAYDDKYFELTIYVHNGASTANSEKLGVIVREKTGSNSMNTILKTSINPPDSGSSEHYRLDITGTDWEEGDYKDLFIELNYNKSMDEQDYDNNDYEFEYYVTSKG